MAVVPLPAQSPEAALPPLAQDSGAAGLRLALLRLHTTARLLHTTAHPDDEDGGMLVLEARGHGVAAELLTLTRGEGGQNRLGSGLLDDLGILRTLEMMASSRQYGVEQRFAHVADFGFSKSAAETFTQWHGHDIALGDMVRVIRTFRPDVIVSRFQGADRDGHGHHQASGILAREAFRAAADPARFPEQIDEGLLPWQARKLYVDNVHEGESYTVALDTGADNSELGMSYRQFAMQGLKHQLSQGAGNWSVTPGPYLTRYLLVDSAMPGAADGEGHEKDFFDGIDTSLDGLAGRLAPGENAPWLRRELHEISARIDAATEASQRAPEDAVAPLLEGLARVNSLLRQIAGSSLSGATKIMLTTELETKREQFLDAARLAVGLNIEAVMDDSASAPESAGAVVPGETVTLSLTASANPHVALKIISITPIINGQEQATIAVPGGQQQSATGAIALAAVEVAIPQDAEFTRPYFHRNRPETDTIYELDEPRCVTLPLGPPAVQLRVQYEAGGRKGEVTTTALATYKDGESVAKRPLAIAPALSVLITPPARVMPASQQQPLELEVSVRSNVKLVREGELMLQAPFGWKIQPRLQPVNLSGKGAQRTYRLYVLRTTAGTGSFPLQATVRWGGESFEQGYTVVERADLGSAYYYQPAVGRITVMDVDVPTNIRVGYVMGAGDDIPAVLRDVGIDLKMISPEELATGDLQHYGTIILGIRAYDVREDVRQYNRRLLDYVHNGGTLVVQYNSDLKTFNAGHFTPYPAELGRERVTDENAPFELLDANDDAFGYPNELTAADFQGWVQERGLYFMHTWDPRYTPLLACNDPGEEPLKGGLLRAVYGKGVYFYTGLSFFRQLPAGVPGAIRMFVNIVAAESEWKR